MGRRPAIHSMTFGTAIGSEYTEEQTFWLRAVAAWRQSRGGRHPTCRDILLIAHSLGCTARRRRPMMRWMVEMVGWALALTLLGFAILVAFIHRYEHRADER